MTDTARRRTFSDLSAAMCRYSPASPAWLDFVVACQSPMESAAARDDAAVPDELWVYWSSVAAGENGDYDANGARTTSNKAGRASKKRRPKQLDS